MNTTLETTPAIPAANIRSQRYLGMIDTEEGETHIVSIETPDGHFLVAGGACNAGMLPQFARAYDPECENIDEALQELVADLEAGDYPSGELLAWHGSLVI